MPFHWIWKTKVCKKIKVFIWLRLNSRNLLRRKNYKVDDNDDFSCVFCPAPEETTYHLFFQCPFSEICWNYLNIHWDHSTPFFQTIIKAKEQFNPTFFMEVFAVAAWEIWKHRNACIFRSGNISFEDWKTCFTSTLKLQLLRCKESERDIVCSWLNSL